MQGNDDITTISPGVVDDVDAITTEKTYSDQNSDSTQGNEPSNSMQDEEFKSPNSSNEPILDDDEYESSNSFDNVIPIDKIKNGWGLMYNFVKAKAQEISNSETMKEIKTKTTPIWEAVTDFTAKNTTVLKPAAEKAVSATVETFSYLGETTKQISDDMKLAEKTQKVKEKLEQGWTVFTEAAEKGAVATAEGIQKISQKIVEHTAPPPISVRDAKGMTI